MRDLLTWSFPLAPLFGVMIRVHFTLPLVMIGLIGREYVRDGAPVNSWHDAAMLMGLMFLSILMHEFGHCFAARFVGGESDEILMWPLGGLAFARTLPHTWPAHLVFSAGGPLMDFAKCVVLGLVLFFGYGFVPPLNPIPTNGFPYRAGDGLAIALTTSDGTSLLTENLAVIFVARFFWISWVLMIFNLLLLGHPFDSGRMLQAGLWPWLGHYQSTYVAIYFGYVVMLIVVVLSLVYKEPLLLGLAFFVYFSCAQEMANLETAHEDSLFGYDFSQGYTSLEKDEPPPPRAKQQNFIQRWLAERAARKAQQEQEQREADERRMDELLAKIAQLGKASLTDEEQRFLKRVADRYKNKP